ncbi:MAG: 3'-5' exonuclease [Proteobacteria bacterium]|jgi:DNA polymerase III epsilon subunit family exonuclease|nr:3'-5' exonuclease [Pseudomonadota bacterium]
MQWKHLPIVALDTETTGFEPFADDRMIEFAAVVFSWDDDGRIVTEDHSWLLNPQIPIPRKVTELTGIADRDVAGAPLFAEVAEEIHSLLRNAVTVAHNFPFDLNFMVAEFERVGMMWPYPVAEIDTLELSKKHFPEAPKHKLSDMSKRLDVVLEGAHRATNDAEACGRCFVELVRRHDVEDDLQALLEWAEGIGRPPGGGPIALHEGVGLEFVEGQHANSLIGEHPIELAWMAKARVRHDNGWQWRYPESTRQWIRRWLRVRGTGVAIQSKKSFRAEDWVLDSCNSVEAP